jgi:O-antigen ligase
MVYAAALTVPTVGSIIGIQSDGTRVKDYRETLLERGLEEAHKSPLVGVDLETLTYRLRDMRQGEGIIDFVNSYLYILLVTGLVGLAAFVTALTWPIYDIWSARRRVPSASLMDNSYLGGALAAIAMMLVTTSLGARSLMAILILVALASALTRAAVGRGKSSERVSERGYNNANEPMLASEAS